MQAKYPLTSHALDVNRQISKALRNPMAKFWPSELVEALAMTGDMLIRLAESIENGHAGRPTEAGNDEGTENG